MKTKIRCCSKYSKKRRSKKCYVFINSRHVKSEKYITPMNFAEHFRKSDVSENSKVCYDRFLRNGLHEGIAILASTVIKIRWDAQYLEVC